MRLRYAALLLLAACEQKSTPVVALDAAVVAEAAAPSVPEAAAPVVVIVDAAAPAHSAAAAARPPPVDNDLYYKCKATVGDTQVATADVLPHPVHGTEKATVTITSKGTTRKLLTTVTPHAATVILMFEAYAPGDEKPADETLVPGKTMILRLVSMGDDTDLFPEAPLFGKIPSMTPSRCAR